MEIKQIIETSSLPSLSAADPELWSAVFADIKGRVTAGQAASLGELRARNVAVLNQWRGALNSPFAQSSHARTTVLKAKLTVLAVDQFADAFTGKIGPAPSIKDRLIYRATIARILAKQKCVSVKEFDRSWSLIENKAWAAAQMQKQGYWSVPCLEFISRIKDHAQGRAVLELGAGLGFFAAALQGAGIVVHACDDYSWDRSDAPMESPMVKKMDAVSALKILKPAVVLCSWPPPQNTFEEEIFKTPSVQCYIAIVSQHRFASGNWLAYQRQSQFTCTTSDPFNHLLRPIEAEQQALIFRRR